MRKGSKAPAEALIFALLAAFGTTPLLPAADTSTTGYGAVSQVLLQRAQADVARISALVDQGTLPKSQLELAQARLADAQDEAILSATLYGQLRLEDMSSQQGQAMVDAAQRRVARQAKIVDDRQKLLAMGILARAEVAADQDELASRQQVLQLAQNRVALLAELRTMAENEQRLEHAAQISAASVKNVMLRYDGNGLFDLGDLTAISAQFEKHFHQPLPVSARGQTLLHQSLGLDHRNRVDIALNPDQPEGVWLRSLLERLHVPYLAFRSAVAGAATAPHIHIGTASTRLKLAQR